MHGTPGRSNSFVWEVRSSGPSVLENRSTVTVTSGLRCAKPSTAFSASTMSDSRRVRGGCGRRIASVKYAGSSCSQP